MKEGEITETERDFALSETVYTRDIETKVIQIIILQAMSKITGVAGIEKGLIDSLFGREVERVKGIHVEQDLKTHVVRVKVELNVEYGISIPEKIAEVQETVVTEITRLTGLHVAAVHVVVKGIILSRDQEEGTRDVSVEKDSTLVNDIM